MRALAWVRAKDPAFAALRRAARGAVVMPAMFAIGDEVIGNAAVATFAAFGSFALVLLVEFSGSMIDRLRSQASLVVTGAAFVCLGTLASRSTWLATLSMLVVGFCVLFAGVVSSVLAAATVSLLLAFILPVSVPAPASQIPDRLAGWAMAGAASLFAITVLWPAPVSDRLRAGASAACRSIAARLRADAKYLLAHDDRARGEREAAVERAEDATASLARLFLATPYRPAGLSVAAQAVVRLVDEIAWLHAIVDGAPQHPRGLPLNESACGVRVAAAGVLDDGADLLDRTASPDAMRAAVVRLQLALAEVEGSGALGERTAGSTADTVTALDPGFRAQELAFAVSQIAGNIDTVVIADGRPWHQRLFGRAAGALPNAASAARRRALAHLEPHSVWLHNSLRGAAGLALAVLVATLTGVQHSFWVILGTLSVLRSNALNTGQSVFRGLVGTAAGVVIGAGLIALVGTNTTVLWVLLPFAVLGAGFAPAAFSFAAGQAAFTVTLVILFNIIQPTGWHVGLIRIEDVALGFAISLVVGALFWPRGAIGALRRELSEAYSWSARYLGAAVEFGVERTEPRSGVAAEPRAESGRAAAAAGRLDDAFRTYLAERAAKPVSLAAVTGLVNGVVALRLAGDAVVDLWRRDGGSTTTVDSEVGSELRALALGVIGWYEVLAAALDGSGRVPEPLGFDASRVERVLAAVDDDRGEDEGARVRAARIVWTCDHLDAVRRLQGILVEPAEATVGDRRS